MLISCKREIFAKSKYSYKTYFQAWISLYWYSLNYLSIFDFICLCINILIFYHQNTARPCWHLKLNNDDISRLFIMMTCNDCPFCVAICWRNRSAQDVRSGSNAHDEKKDDTQRKSDDKSPLKMLFLMTLTPNMIWIIFLMAFTRVDWVLWETNPFYILDKYIS